MTSCHVTSQLTIGSLTKYLCSNLQLNRFSRLKKSSKKTNQLLVHISMANFTTSFFWISFRFENFRECECSCNKRDWIDPINWRCQKLLFQYLFFTLSSHWMANLTNSTKRLILKLKVAWNFVYFYIIYLIIFHNNELRSLISMIDGFYDFFSHRNEEKNWKLIIIINKIVS